MSQPPGRQRRRKSGTTCRLELWLKTSHDHSMADDTAALMLALYQPDIPQNAGTLLRTCACLGVMAALIEPAGFPISDRHFRRAGMDYLDHVVLSRHVSFAAFQQWRSKCRPAARLILLTTAAATSYLDVRFEPGDILMVGRESAGVPPDVHAVADVRVMIRMRPPMRSLNVAVAASMVLGEALRQLDRGEAAGERPS